MVMAEDPPLPDFVPKADFLALKEELEQLKQIAVGQLMSHNQSIDEIMRLIKIEDMKVNAFEMRLNAAVEEMRLNVEKLPLQAVKLINSIQTNAMSKMVKNMSGKNAEDSKPKESPLPK